LILLTRFLCVLYLSQLSLDLILLYLLKSIFTPSLKNPYKTYRSYKQFNYEAFIQDLDNAKLDEQIINDNKDIHKTYFS
jgi:hypothetical protein